MDKSTYLSVREFAELNKKNNTWPQTDATIWALRSQNQDFQKAFFTIGRKVLIDVECFWNIIKKQKAKMDESLKKHS